MGIEIATSGFAKVQAGLVRHETRVRLSHDRIVRAWARTVAGAERRYIRSHHNRSGRFARTGIKVFADRPGEAKAKAVGPLAHLVIAPTAAHEIYPGARRALTVGAREVEHAHHPGTKGDDFMRRVAEEVRGEAMIAAREEYLHGI